jgi:hypothetical protein
MKRPLVAKHVNADRLERFLGRDKIAHLSDSFRTWYGPPVRILDLPGCVSVCGGGDFIGEFNHGYAVSAYELMRDYLKRFWDESGKFKPALVGVGFASISDALLRASQGYAQMEHVSKAGPTQVVNSAHSLWRVGNLPAAGGAGAAPVAGTAHTSANTGAISFDNPVAGTMHLVGADFTASAINSLLLYDRLFSVAKTIASITTESITGVPTRYQSSTASAADYAGGNFAFPEVGATAYANTAHNWTVCRYRNQAGTDTISFPSVAGNPGAVATIADRLDIPVGTWYMPLASGDSGVMDLDQMQCSASVATGALNFVIGHPIGVMAMPVANLMFPFNWLTNRNQAPRIFDSACMALLVLPGPATTATTYGGMLHALNAAA